MARFGSRGTKPGRKKLPKLTEKQQKYVMAKIEYGDNKKALQVAGYSPTARPDHNVSVQVHLERQKKIVEKKFLDRAEEMADNMYNLALNADSENVRYQATKDYLDRAGFNPTSKTQIENKFITAEQQISRDLIDRLNSFKREKNAKVVDNEIDAEIIEIK